jgi:hypothetical protein
MDNISNGLGFGGSSDPKAAVMNQVRQEAAMSNARALIEVGHISSCSSSITHGYNRKSTSTASRSVYPSLEPRYPAARRPALRNAWRSTWRHGTLSADSISTGYSRSQQRVLVGEECFKGLIVAVWIGQG